MRFKCAKCLAKITIEPEGNTSFPLDLRGDYKCPGCSLTYVILRSKHNPQSLKAFGYTPESVAKQTKEAGWPPIDSPVTQSVGQYVDDGTARFAQ